MNRGGNRGNFGMRGNNRGMRGGNNMGQRGGFNNGGGRGGGGQYNNNGFQKQQNNFINPNGTVVGGANYKTVLCRHFQ